MYDVLVDLGRHLPPCEKKRQIYGKFNQKFYQGNNQRFLHQMIEDAIEVKDFKFAQKANIQIYYSKELSQKLFSTWFESVQESERDLLLTRFVLMKTAVNKAKQAYEFYLDICNWPEIHNSPLNRFLQLFFKSLDIRSKQVFVRNREVFKGELERDPEFSKLLDRIGFIFLGIEMKQEFNLMSMIGNLFN